MWNLNISLFLCLCLIVALLIRLITSRKKNEKIDAFMAAMPGPTGGQALGSALVSTGISRSNVFRTLMEISRKYSRSRFGVIWILGEPYLFTSDPSIFKALLSSSQNINKPKDYDFFKAFSQGIFLTNGSDWHKMRKIINPTTKASALESFAGNFKYHTEIFLDTIHKHTVTGNAFDICLLLHTCTIDLACDNHLEFRVDAQKKKLRHFSTNLKKSLEMIFERSFSFPLWSNTLYSLLGKQKELDDAIKPMQNLAKEIVEQHVRRALESRNEKAVKLDNPKTFMEIMVDNVLSGNLSRDQAVEETIDMFIAGSTNISTASSWVFKMFAMRPDIQKRVYDEIVEICKEQEEVTFNDLPKLSYLEMVIKETLRNFGVPFVLRQLTDDLKVNDDLNIPAGMNIVLINFLLHHDPEYWERPGEFYPEHFSVENESKREKNSFFPFADGPRMCPGSKYAMLSMTYIIANTLLRYEFYSDEKLPDDISKDDFIVLFMLYPASGFRVKIKDRQQT